MNNKQIQEKTNLSMSTVERTIKSLNKKGLIERVGSKKTGYWKVIEWKILTNGEKNELTIEICI